MSQDERHFDIQQIAHLARIDVDPDEQDELQAQISKVLNLVDTIEELDLSDIAPFFGVGSTGFMRADELAPGLSRVSVLNNAPDQDGRFFRVPPVFN